MVHCAFCNDCHEETDFSVIVFIENDLTKLINKKTRKKCRKSRCFMLAPRAKPAARVSIPTNKLQSKCCVSKQFLDLAKLTFSIYQFRSHLLAKWVKLNPSAKTKLINKKTREKYRKS